MTPVGETLRRARLKRNLELNRIADELKISAAMLKAIEEEQFDKLPGGVFVRSFVRQYARLLELDEDEIMGALQQTLGPTPQPPQAAPAQVAQAGISLPRMSGWQAIGDPASRWASPVRALGLVVIVLLACAGAYTWLERGRRPVAVHKQKPAAEQHAPAAAATAPPQTAPATGPSTEAATRPAEPAPPVEAHGTDGSPAPASKSGGAPSAPGAAAPESASAITPAAAPPAPANPDAPVRVEIVADQESWVSLSADGKSAFIGVMDASQSRTVAASRDVKLKVGNAGGVTVRLNGKPIGPLGAEGEVKSLQLTPGGFKILPPDVPKPGPLTDPTDPANP